MSKPPEPRESSQTAWLPPFLERAATEPMCTKPYCTTCGAMPFRRGFRELAAGALGRPAQGRIDMEIAVEIARQLALVPEPERMLHERVFQAMRLIFCELWNAVGPAAAEAVLVPLLQGTWSEQVRRQMYVHHNARAAEARRIQQYESPEAVRARREEKKRLRQEKHRQRLEAKKERDRIWFEQQRLRQEAGEE